MSRTVSWKADFSGATIERTDFSSSELGSAKFFDTDLSDSELYDAILWQTEFKNSVLTPEQCAYAEKEEAIFLDDTCKKRGEKHEE